MAENSLKPKNIICLGDSHACFFSGEDLIQKQYPEISPNRIPFIKGIRLGAVLAYSLHKENTTNRGRESLFEIISGLDKNQVSILFCFGEIDCRFHILKQAEKKGKRVEECIEDCVERYFEVIKEVRGKGFEVLVWNVIPTSNLNNNPEYPHYGTPLQRNLCTKYFNDILKECCNKHGILFIDIFNKLISKSLHTKEYFFFDGLHLGQIAMPFFIKEINKYFPHIDLPAGRKFFWYYDLIKTYLIFRTGKLKKALKRFLNKL